MEQDEHPGWRRWSDLIPRNIEVVENPDPARLGKGLGPDLGQLTDWAKKYGHSRDPTLSVTGENFTPRRSGLSPQTLSLDSVPLSPLEQAKRDELDQFEIKELNLKLRDLRDLEILEAESLKLNNLDFPICPILDKSRWIIRKCKFKMPEVFGDKFWSVEVPEVWRIMEPILKLASMFLTNPFCMNDWWDALVNGRFRIITAPRAPAGPTLRSFDFRSPEIRFRQPFPWQELSEQVGYMLFDGRKKDMENRDDYGPQPGGFSGITNLMGSRKNKPGNTQERLVKVDISYHIILPLLGDLTDAEQLIQSFEVAKVIIHETCHVCWTLTTNFWEQRFDPATDRRLWINWEPYYKRDSVAELGHAMENLIFGGVIRFLIRDPREKAYKKGLDLLPRGIPALGITQATWPSYQQLCQKGPFRVPLLDQKKWEGRQTSLNRFIPVTWCSEIQQNEFWSVCISKFGYDAVKPFPIIRGTLYERNKKGKVKQIRWQDKSFEGYPKQKIGRSSDQDIKEWQQRRYDRIANAVIRQRLREKEEMKWRRSQDPHITAEEMDRVERWKEKRAKRRAEMKKIWFNRDDA